MERLKNAIKGAINKRTIGNMLNTRQSELVFRDEVYGNLRGSKETEVRMSNGERVDLCYKGQDGDVWVEFGHYTSMQSSPGRSSQGKDNSDSRKLESLNREGDIPEDDICVTVQVLTTPLFEISEEFSDEDLREWRSYCKLFRDIPIPKTHPIKQMEKISDAKSYMGTPDYEEYFEFESDLEIGLLVWVNEL